MARRSPVRLEVGGHLPHAGWYVDLIVPGRRFSLTTYRGTDGSRWGATLGGGGVMPSVMLNGYGVGAFTRRTGPTLKSLEADVRFLGEELRQMRRALVPDRDL